MTQVTFAKLALRDAAVVVIAITAWALLPAYHIGEGPLSDLLGVVLGAGLGACAYLFHEWGHLVCGLLTRSRMAPGSSLGSFSNFVFDSRANNRFQFLLMSLGGFVATAITVWLFYRYLPDGELATHVARGIVLFLAFLAVVLEFPLVLWAIFRRDLPPIDRKRGAHSVSVPSR